MNEIQQPVFTALADPVRRSLILNLAETSHVTATQFAEIYPISRQGILKHLNILYKAGLVVTRKNGRDVEYELRAAALTDVEKFIGKVGAKLDERLLRLKTLVEGE
jgi:DNA-binding transcriptional ArsR family regulator